MVAAAVPLRIDETDPLADPEGCGRLWRLIEAKCPGASPFVRWPWVSAWLQVYGAALAPRLLIGRRGSRLVGVALVGRRLIWRHGVFPVRQLYLNTTGEQGPGSACVEFNQLLCPPADRAAFAGALYQHLAADRSWDEIALSGFLPEDLPELGAVQVLRERPSHAMDLTALRQRGQLPEEQLSANTRQQIRRSLKLFGGREALRLERAGTAAEADRMLGELVELHQASWRRRGQHGAFEDGRLRRFLDLVIDTAPLSAPLLRLRDGAGRTIGVACYFLDRQTAYYYQSGLRHFDDGRMKPGLCLHLLAMEHFQRLGIDRYDFMASDLRYKQSLSSGQRRLLWGSVQRPRLHLWAEQLAVGLVRRARHGARDTAGGGGGRRSIRPLS